MAPPGRSRLPVSTLRTSTAQAAMVPNATVWVPIRPYTAADSACGQLPGQGADALGIDAGDGTHDLGGERRRRPRPARRGRSRASASAPRSTSDSVTSTWIIAIRRWASVPGTMASQSSACSAVFVRRGSTTTTFPPRARMASMRPGKSGAVHRLPLRLVGVGAEHQQVVGAVEVGDRDEQRIAEQVAARHVLGHLVDGRRRVDVGRAQRLDEGAVVDRGAEGVDAGVAEVDGHGVAAVGVDHPTQAGARRRRTPRPR